MSKTLEGVDVDRMIRSYESRLALANAKLDVATMELRRLKTDVAECLVLAGLPPNADIYRLMVRLAEIRQQPIDKG